jgi:hypothetical protein
VLRKEVESICGWCRRQVKHNVNRSLAFLLRSLQSLDIVLVLQGFGLGALLTVLVAYLNSVSRLLILLIIDAFVFLRKLRAVPTVIYVWVLQLRVVPLEYRLTALRLIPRGHIRGLLEFVPHIPGAIAAGRLVGLVALKRIVLQVVTGLVADALSMPVVPTTLASRLSWALHHPVSFTLSHWLFGVIVLALTSTIVLQMRESLRYPLVAKWTRQNNANLTQVLREIMDRPVHQQIRGTCVMLLLCTAFVVGLILVPMSFATVTGSRVQLLPASSSRSVAPPHLMRSLGGTSESPRDLWTINASEPLLHWASSSPTTQSRTTVNGTDNAIEVSALTAAESLLSTLRSGDLDRGSLTVLSVQCNPLPGISLPRAFPAARNERLQDFPPRCPPMHVLAIKLHVSSRHYSSYGLPLSDTFVFDSDVDSVRPFSFRGYHSLVPEDEAVPPPPPEVAGAEPTNSSDPTAQTTLSLVLMAGKDFAVWCFGEVRTIVDTMWFIASTLRSLVSSRAAEQSMIDAKPPGSRSADPSPSSKSSSFIRTTDPSLVYAASDEAPVFNVTIIEGSHEFSVLAPALWRAMALHSLEDEMDVNQLRANETQAAIACGSAWNESDSRWALASIPVGMSHTSFIVVCSGRRETLKVVNESNVVGASTADSAAPGALDADTVESASHSVLPGELFLRRMPVFRFVSLTRTSVALEQMYMASLDASSAEGAARQQKLQKDFVGIDPYVFVWRLRHAGAVMLDTTPHRHTTTLTSSNERAAEDHTDANNTSRNVSVSVLRGPDGHPLCSIMGSRFEPVRTYDLSYRLPVTLSPRVDDISLYWASPSRIASLLHPLETGSIDLRSGLSELFRREDLSLSNHSSMIAIDASHSHAESAKNESLAGLAEDDQWLRLGQIMKAGPYAGLRVCKRLDMKAVDFFSASDPTEGLCSFFSRAPSLPHASVHRSFYASQI